MSALLIPIPCSCHLPPSPSNPSSPMPHTTADISPLEMNHSEVSRQAIKHAAPSPEAFQRCPDCAHLHCWVFGFSHGEACVLTSSYLLSLSSSVSLTVLLCVTENDPIHQPNGKMQRESLSTANCQSSTAFSHTLRCLSVLNCQSPNKKPPSCHCWYTVNKEPQQRQTVEYH